LQSPEQGKDAQMAKLVDALCSGRSVRKDVLVRIQFWAPAPFQAIGGAFFVWGSEDILVLENQYKIPRSMLYHNQGGEFVLGKDSQYKVLRRPQDDSHWTPN
jgi:hypothetical protein